MNWVFRVGISAVRKAILSWPLFSNLFVVNSSRCTHRSSFTPSVGPARPWKTLTQPFYRFVLLVGIRAGRRIYPPLNTPNDLYSAGAWLALVIARSASVLIEPAESVPRIPVRRPSRIRSKVTPTPLPSTVKTGIPWAVPAVVT